MTDIKAPVAAGYIIADRTRVWGVGKTDDEAAQLLLRVANSKKVEGPLVRVRATQELLDFVVRFGGGVHWSTVCGIACSCDEACDYAHAKVRETKAAKAGENEK